MDPVTMTSIAVIVVAVALAFEIAFFVGAGAVLLVGWLRRKD